MVLYSKLVPVCLALKQAPSQLAAPHSQPREISPSAAAVTVSVTYHILHSSCTCMYVVCTTHAVVDSRHSILMTTVLCLKNNYALARNKITTLKNHGIYVYMVLALAAGHTERQTPKSLKEQNQ